MRQTSARVRDWLRSFFPQRDPRKPARPSRPRLEELESRRLLSTTWHFAFAPTGTVVAGYTSVGLSPYTPTPPIPAPGYGWTAAAGTSLVQHSAPTALDSHFVQGPTDGSVCTFQANLDPGTYTFTFELGDQTQAHTGMQLSVNGTTLAPSLSTAPGQFLDETYTVNVSGTQPGIPVPINLQAASGSSFALNALDIVPWFHANLTTPASDTVNTSSVYSVSTSGGTGPNYTYAVNFMDGTGTHQGTVAAATHATNQTYVVNGQYHIMAQVTDSAGHFETMFKTLTVTGTSVFHISATGSDNNDGSVARPWATVTSVANHYTFGPGDKILFQGGATFQGSLSLGLSYRTDPAGHNNLAGTAANPVTIGSYGTGHAILNMITQGLNDNGITISDASGVLIQGLDLLGPWTPTNPPPADNPLAYAIWSQSGIRVQDDADINMNHFYIDDVRISGFAGSLISGYPGGAGINFTASPSINGVVRDIAITNCTITNNFGMGVSFQILPAAQIYKFQDVLVDHVQVMNGRAIQYSASPSNPIYLQNVSDGVVEHCSVSHNDLTCYYQPNAAPKSVGITAAESQRILFQYNESAANYSNSFVFDSSGATQPVLVDTDGFDFDGGVFYSVMQYNYSHDNDGAGFLLSDLTVGAYQPMYNVVRYNITQNDCRRNPYGAISMSAAPVPYWYASEPINYTEIYNNTIYLTPTTTGQSSAGISIQDNAMANHVHFRDNLILVSGNMPVLNGYNPGGTDLLFQGNDYFNYSGTLTIQWFDQYTATVNTYHDLASWRADNREELVGTTPVGLSVDPQLVNPGQAGTGLNTDQLPAGLVDYKLRAGSPVARAGLNLASFGITWDPYGFATNTFLKAYFSATPTDLFGHSLVGRTTFSIGADQEGS